MAIATVSELDVGYSTAAALQGLFTLPPLKFTLHASDVQVQGLSGLSESTLVRRRMLWFGRTWIVLYFQVTTAVHIAAAYSQISPCCPARVLTKIRVMALF